MLEAATHNRDNWGLLTPDLIRKIAGHMHANDVATALKLTNKAAASSLSGIYDTVQLLGGPDDSEPDLPLAAHPWPGDAFVAHWGRPQPWRSLSLHQRRRLLCLAASSGHEPSLDAALAHCGCGLAEQVVAAAAAAGDLAACQRLVAEGCDCSSAAVRMAARRGHLNILQWIWGDCDPQLQLRRAFGWMEVGPIAEAACEGGQEQVLNWLEEVVAGLPPPPEPQQSEAAAGAGQVAGAANAGFIPFGDWVFVGMVKQAAANGHSQLLARLLDSGRYAPHVAGFESYYQASILGGISRGCPLDVLQRYWAEWAPDFPDQLHIGVLLQTLYSPTPDWQAKADFVWSRCGLVGPAAGWAADAQRAVNNMIDCFKHDGAAACQADYLQRWQWLAARAGLAAGSWRRQAGVRLAAAGRADALADLLDELEAAAGAEQLERTYVPCLAYEAAAWGQTAVLELLCHRYGPNILTIGNLSDLAKLAMVCGPGRDVEAFVEALAQNEGFSGRRGEAVSHSWSEVLASLCRHGARLPLLQLLHERRAAAINVLAVAGGGSEEALAWAVRKLQNVQINWRFIFFELAQHGNLAAAGWLLKNVKANVHMSQGTSGTSGVSDLLPNPADVEASRGWRSPINVLRFWVLCNGGSMAAAASPEGVESSGGGGGAASSSTTASASPSEWARLLAFVESKPFKGGKLHPHQLVWLRRQRLASAERRLAAAVDGAARGQAEAELAAARAGLEEEVGMEEGSEEEVPSDDD